MRTSAARNNKQPLISVVIPTHNRADLLSRAITSVVGQDLAEHDYEVIVVDNGSTDRTQEVVKAFAANGIVRCVFEARLGAAIARNTGWQAARGRYLAYFDDDTVAEPGWLADILTAFQSAPTDVGAIGGPVIPIWEAPRPPWLSDEILVSLAIVDWSRCEKFIENLRREWLVSANMAIPRDVLAKIGGFETRLDRVGGKLISSGEIFLQRQLVRQGYRILYRPTMAIRHLVPSARLQTEYFFKRYYWQGVSDAAIFLLEKSPDAGERCRLALERTRSMTDPKDPEHYLRSPGGNQREFTMKCMALFEAGYVAGLLGAAGF